MVPLSVGMAQGGAKCSREGTLQHNLLVQLTSKNEQAQGHGVRVSKEKVSLHQAITFPAGEGAGLSGQLSLLG